MQYTQELSIAVAAVRHAAEVCRNVQRAIPAAMEKQDKSPVTIADLRLPENEPSLDRVQSELSRVGVNGSPDEICGWIDRGGAKSFGPRFWTLDPIDGTKGFLRGEQYAVSLALIVDGQITVALLGCPNLPLEAGGTPDDGTLFFAVRGQGASVQSCFGNSATAPVRVTSTSSWADVRLCESVESGHSAHDRSAMISASLGIVKQPVRLDSQAKYAVVARGEGDVYLRLPTKKDYREKIWDHAGGVLVVEEAGGQVTDIDGKPLEFTHGRELSANRGVVVTNGRLHDDVLCAIREHVG
ncbi:MAG: 3'(2') 5'-bisphosphate nucleotidase HAL2 family [Planctomycetota bacterium]|nr:MAG: 3'(2') 5'-bisphosphate nucleotidase HAL2 family [Planctomycetota bacterium]